MASNDGTSREEESSPPEQDAQQTPLSSSQVPLPPQQMPHPDFIRPAPLWFGQPGSGAFIPGHSNHGMPPPPSPGTLNFLPPWQHNQQQQQQPIPGGWAPRVPVHTAAAAVGERTTSPSGGSTFGGHLGGHGRVVHQSSGRKRKSDEELREEAERTVAEFAAKELDSIPTGVGRTSSSSSGHGTLSSKDKGTSSGGKGGKGDKNGLSDNGGSSDEEEKEPLRTDTPHYYTWSANDLKAKVKEIAANDGLGYLEYGSDEDSRMRGFTNVKKSGLVEVLVKRKEFQDRRGLPQDYRHWGPITPEKAKKKQKQGRTPAEPRKEHGSVCRMICLMSDENIFKLFDKSNQEPSRDAKDAKEVGSRHVFLQTLAEAMINREWEGSNGGPISLISFHEKDNPPAPPDLIEALRSVDIVGPATTMKTCMFKENEEEEGGKLAMLPMQKALEKWIKGVKSDHTEMRRKEDLSGGAGADPVDEGEDDSDNSGDDEGDGGGSDGVGGGGRSGGNKKGKVKNAVHTWSFCGGKLPTILWNDLMQTMAGGDYGVADVILPDGAPGAGTSVPGGTGTRSTIDLMDKDMSEARAAKSDTVRSEPRKGPRRAKEKGKRTDAGAGKSTIEDTVQNLNTAIGAIIASETRQGEADKTASRVDEDPLVVVQDAAAKLEEARMRLLNLDEGAAVLTRKSLRAVVKGREKNLEKALELLPDSEDEEDEDS